MLLGLKFRPLAFAVASILALSSGAVAHPSDGAANSPTGHQHFHCHQNQSCHSHSHDAAHH
jgi:hypothetical protein